MNKEYEYNIKLENGKYNMVLTKDYKIQYLRGGEVWVEDPPAPKMLIAFMDKFEQLENQLKELKTYWTMHKMSLVMYICTIVKYIKKLVIS